jgi:prepilin-type N-terminal cleavage/methylation domain-containing protein
MLGGSFLEPGDKLMKTNSKQQGFTLVEIMIVVLIIGILLAIAIPNFVQAREASRAKSCVANLKQIDSAKQQWAMDTKQAAGATPAQTDLEPTYVKSYPACPSGGSYTLGSMSTTPSCSVTGASGTGYASGEKWYHGL